MDANLLHYIYQLSYFGVFLWFAVLEQFTPIPEEASLMSLGYISMHTNLSPWLGGIVALAGLISTDNFLFYLSLKGNKLSQRLLHKANSTLQDKIRHYLQLNTNRALFVMALLPKVRFFSPIIAASAGVSWKQYFIVNLVATLLYVTVYMIIGIAFHRQMQSIFKELHLPHHFIFIAFVVILSIVFFLLYQKENKRTD